MSAARRHTIVLLTTGQPATSPRVAKEADALAAAGHDVTVIGTYWVDWAVAADERAASQRAWAYAMLDWRRERRPWLFWKSRVRHRTASFAAQWPVVGDLWLTATAGRTTPELTRLAVRHAADLYIAHTLGALPAAWHAAVHHSAQCGFDAEDFHSGQFAHGSRDPRRSLAERIEKRYVPRVDYVTAASPGIAAAYAPLRSSPPVTVLNAFPLRERPASHRARVAGERLRMYWCSQTIGPDRGLEDAVRAAGLAGPGIEIHLQGKCWPGYEAQLRQVAAEAGVAPDRLVFHAPIAPEALVAASAAYDIGLAVEPPVSRNNEILLSNKIFTYLLGGLAILATRTAGQQWLQRHTPEAARLCEPGDAAAMAAVLRHWQEHPEELALARSASWRYGSERYNWDLEQQLVIDLVDDLFSRRTDREREARRPAIARAAGGSLQ